MQVKPDVLKKIVFSAELLKSTLKTNPQVVNEQDENGNTLLHHAALIGRKRGSWSAGEILNVLFTSPHLDFTVKNNDGNTPLHVAALSCDERTTCQFVFPALVKEASNRGFDFSILGGKSGQTVLHIATRTSYTDPRGVFGRINNVKNVLDNASQPGLDTLSTSGSTAFYYAINFCHFAEAKSLLEAGANPILFGSEQRNPVSMLEEHIACLKDILSKPEEEPGYHEKAKYFLQKVNEIKVDMKKNPQTRSHAEIRKNSYLLAQAKRTNTFFANVPDAIMMKIASHTGNSACHTEEETNKIARTFLDRPKK
jgi:FOG: Ankyrin repeat